MGKSSEYLKLKQMIDDLSKMKMELDPDSSKQLSQEEINNMDDYGKKQYELNNLLQSYFTLINRIAFCFYSTSSHQVLFLENQLLFSIGDISLSETNPSSNNVTWLIDTIKNFNVSNVDFFACETLKNSYWMSYFDFLMLKTNVIIGASDDKTGNIKYGGDWVMESTYEDVRTVYFTNDIEIYEYLFDVTGWSSGYTNTYVQMAIDGNNLYYPHTSNNNILQKSTSTGGTASIWLDGLSTDSAGIVYYGGFFYVSNRAKNSISKLDASGNIVTQTWATTTSPSSIVIDTTGTFMYVINHLGRTNYITKINLSNGSIVGSDQGWATVLWTYALAIDDTYLYISCTGAGRIIRLALSGSGYTESQGIWFTGIVPFGIDISGGFMYLSATESSVNKLKKIDLSNASATDLFTFNRQFGPLRLTSDKVYVSEESYGMRIYDMSGNVLLNQLAVGSGWFTIANSAVYLLRYTKGEMFSTDLSGNITGRNLTNQIITPLACVISGGFMYVLNSDTIAKVNLTTKNVNYTWVSGLNILTSAMSFSGNYLYVVNSFLNSSNQAKIARIDITTGSKNLSWYTFATQNVTIVGSTISGNMMYVSYTDGGITRINLTATPTPTETYYAGSLTFTKGLAVYANSLYVSHSGGIAQVNTTTNLVTNSTWKSVSGLLGMVFSGAKLYVATTTSLINIYDLPSFTTFTYSSGSTVFYSGSATLTSAGVTLTDLTSANITNDITDISGAIFSNSTGLTSFTFDASNNITSLASSFFSGCTSLSTVVLPSGLTSIPNSCFNNCTSLNSISVPNSVTSYGSNCWEGSGLTSFTISRFVTSAGSSCFNNCTNLVSLSIDASNNMTSLGTNFLSGCTNLTSVTLPRLLQVLPNYCLNGCTNLTSLSLPSTVTSLGSYSLANSGLTSITIPTSITTLGTYCFSNCLNLASIILTNSTLTILPQYCFYGSGLSSITIPTSITTLDNYCFSNCFNLTSITIPETVITIGNNCFAGNALTSITFTGR